jgi:hypothetical protein
MEKVFFISILITIFFIAIKFIEMKFIDKELKPLKLLVRDSLIVMICAFLSTFIYFNMDYSVSELLNVVTETKTINPSTTQIFTDDPGF